MNEHQPRHTLRFNTLRFNTLRLSTSTRDAVQCVLSFVGDLAMTGNPGSHVRALMLVSSLLLAALHVSSTRAQSAGAGPVPSAGAAGNAGAASEPPTASAQAPTDPRVKELLARAARIRAFVEGKLDLAVDPAALFDRSPGDEQAVQLEVARLRAIVGSSVDDAATGSAGASPGAVGAAPGPGQTLRGGSPSTSAAGASSGAGPSAGGVTVTAGTSAGGASSEPKPLTTALWEAQLDVDRAYLSFYSLPRERRGALFVDHEKRKKADAEARTAQQLSDAERKAERAETARQRALEEARHARNEATRLVAEELASLLAVTKAQAEFEANLVNRERQNAELQEETLKLRRQVKETIERSQRGEVNAFEVDATYDDLRAQLRRFRDNLSAATLTYAAGESDTPKAEESRLESLPVEVDRAEATKLRGQVAAAARSLERRATDLDAERALTLYQAVVDLNAARLHLLAHLSPDKREAVTSFGPGGLDQAFAESRQVLLVMHYHTVATLRWIAALRNGTDARKQTAFSAGFILFKASIPIVLFLVWRRRSKQLLEDLRQAARDRDRASRREGRTGGWNERAVAFLQRVRVPLQWLLLMLALEWLLPQEVTELLEAQVLLTILGWTLGGTLTVYAIDFIAEDRNARIGRWRRLHDSSEIRFRSLKLMGRVVVAFGLVLSLTSLMVGKGTVYGWMLSLCWFSAFPVGLVLVRWWRAVIFERVDRRRKKSTLDTWVAAQRNGWKSFPAAVLGGSMLLAEGVLRLARTWIGTFELTRRILAYLFRREISKKAQKKGRASLSDLPSTTYEELGPLTPSHELILNVADDQIDAVIARINAPGGGVFAIVGERGLGKTSVLERIVKSASDVHLMQCPFGGMSQFAPAFLTAIGAKDDDALEDAAKSLDDPSHAEGAILVDDAHRLILPMMGGLRHFDRVLAIARKHSTNVAWVFAFDDVIWRFFERMRGTRPLFDDVIRLSAWSEEAITKLLVARSERVSIDPSFDHLIDDLPADADEIDREEALARTEGAYYRLIWDYAAGNPGVALHVWRTLLGVDAKGTPRVRLFEAPSMKELETLPDNAIFVLRALVQLERAQPEALAKATSIPLHEVEDAVRFGAVRGYFRSGPDGYWVSWSWFRVITRFLQRKHLLFAD